MLTPESKILELVVEDFFGLWEIVWHLRSLLPNSTDSELRNIGESAVSKLISKGWVALYRRSSTGGQEKPVSPNEVFGILSDKESWKEPTSNSIHILIGATKEGEHAYATGER